MRSLAATAVVLAATSSFARADEPIPQKARALAQKGRAAHDDGDYPRAIAALKEAYVIAPAPGLLFNLAQAYRLQGNCDDAALMYRRFLATSPEAAGRELARQHLATVERCIRKRSLDIPFDESMAYLRVPAPPPDLGVLDAPGGPDSGASDDRPRSLKQDVGLGLGIGGIASLGVATFYGLRAYSAAQDVEDAYARGVKWKEIEARHAEGKRAATVAKVVGVGGGVALAAGVTLYVLGRREERALPVAVTPTARGAQVSYAWRF